MLSRAQLDVWRDEGCLVLPGFKSEAEVAALRERAWALALAAEPAAPGAPDATDAPDMPGGGADAAGAVFSTTDRKRLSDSALLASAGEVRCFFEEEAVNAAGQLRVPKAQAINKIGHALHDREPLFDRFSRDARLAQLATELGVAEPRLVQSMLIFKQPRIGGEVTWHQDATFLITEPDDSVLGLWFALEEATVDNGCLCIEPGGHRGPLRERYGRDLGAGGRLVMRPLDATPWPRSEQARALPVPAGTLVVLHGRLPHYSAPNRSAVSRLAYTLHVADGRAAWSAQNWLQRGAGFPFRGFG